MELEPDLELGAARVAAGGGGAPGATLTFEWKVTGGSYVEIADAGTAMPTNLASKQLLLQVTADGGSPDLTAIAPNDVGTLTEDGDNTGTLSDGVPLEIPFDMKAGVLAGIVAITLTIGGTDYVLTFHCFQWTGTLRSINPSTNPAGEGTTNITVNGVNIGNASVGYDTLDAADTAASDGDTVVATEEFADGTNPTITKGFTLDVADSVRHDGTITANGYRCTAAATYNGTSGIWRNVRFINTSAGQTGVLHNSKVGGSALVLENCVFTKTGTFQAFATLGDAGGTGAATLRNCIIYAHTSCSGVVLNAVNGNTSIVCQNVTIFGIDTTTDAANGFFNNGGAGGGSFTCVNCIALGVFSSAGYNAGTPGFHANSANNVGNTSTTPPGDDPLTTTAAAYFASVTSSSEDAHCVSRAVLDNFPGTDLSATFTKDIDGVVRTDWYAGADWIAS